MLRFALEELKKAEAGLPEADVPGRVTKYSAKGMMAKLYLYRKDYDSAKAKALEVINSAKYDLVSDYKGMFTSSSFNNNKESLFSTQHQLTQNPGVLQTSCNPTVALLTCRPLKQICGNYIFRAWIFSRHLNQATCVRAELLCSTDGLIHLETQRF